LVPHCVEFLETHYSKYYTFHAFHQPLLFYYFLAKRGTPSLYAPAWIRSGLLLFFLASGIHLAGGDILSPQQGRTLFLGLSLIFWLPGFLLIALNPYRKLWVGLIAQEGAVEITVTSVSPFPLSRKKSVCRTLPSALCAAPTCPAPANPPNLSPV